MMATSTTSSKSRRRAAISESSGDLLAASVPSRSKITSFFTCPVPLRSGELCFQLQARLAFAGKIGPQVHCESSFQLFHESMQWRSGSVPWDPRQVSTQNVNGDCCRHKDSTYPEAPVTVHSSPVRAGIGLSRVAAVSLAVVLVAGHLFSIHAPQQTQGSSFPRGRSVLRRWLAVDYQKTVSPWTEQDLCAVPQECLWPGQLHRRAMDKRGDS